MPRDTVTFRIDADTRVALDQLASALDRDRGYLINEAIEAYLDVHAWQLTHIEEGLRQADTGEFAAESEVVAFWKRFR